MPSRMEGDQGVPKEASVVHTQKLRIQGMDVGPLLAESLRITYIRLPNHSGEGRGL